MVAEVGKEPALMYLYNYKDIFWFSDTVICLRIWFYIIKTDVTSTPHLFK